MWEVTVRGMQRELEIGLLGAGGKAGAGAAPLPEKDDRPWCLGDGGEAEAFGHQGEAGTRGRGRGPHAHVRRTDRHVDAGDLVLTLDDGALILGTFLLEVDAFVSRRADRVVGLHAKACLELGDAN